MNLLLFEMFDAENFSNQGQQHRNMIKGFDDIKHHHEYVRKKNILNVTKYDNKDKPTFSSFTPKHQIYKFNRFEEISNSEKID